MPIMNSARMLPQLGPSAACRRPLSQRAAPLPTLHALRPFSRQTSVFVSRSIRHHAVRSFVVQASDGQITSELVRAMTDKIGKALATDNVKVIDLQGDGRHVSIDVIADAFEGKTAVERQRLVYKAIWVELQGVVHAVDAMTTVTPAEHSKTK